MSLLLFGWVCIISGGRLCVTSPSVVRGFSLGDMSATALSSSVSFKLSLSQTRTPKPVNTHFTVFNICTIPTKTNWRGEFPHEAGPAFGLALPGYDSEEDGDKEQKLAEIHVCHAGLLPSFPSLRAERSEPLLCGTQPDGSGRSVRCRMLVTLSQAELTRKLHLINPSLQSHTSRVDADTQVSRASPWTISNFF